jgi:hypothetical protein
VGMAGNQQVVEVHVTGSESRVQKDKPSFIFGPTFWPWFSGGLPSGRLSGGGVRKAMAF